MVRVLWAGRADILLKLAGAGRRARCRKRIWAMALAGHVSLQNVLSDFICSRIIIYRDGSMIMSLSCYYGGNQRDGACIERNRRVWRTTE